MKAAVNFHLQQKIRIYHHLWLTTVGSELSKGQIRDPPEEGGRRLEASKRLSKAKGLPRRFRTIWTRVGAVISGDFLWTCIIPSQAGCLRKDERARLATGQRGKSTGPRTHQLKKAKRRRIVGSGEKQQAENIEGPRRRRIYGERGKIRVRNSIVKRHNKTEEDWEKGGRTGRTVHKKGTQKNLSTRRGHKRVSRGLRSPLKETSLSASRGRGKAS